jgi:hypothetical protein
VRIETFQHTLDGGWSQPLPARADERALVLVFGAPEYLDSPAALAELERAFDGATVAGCSTSGEILDQEIFDRSLSAAVLRFEHTRVRQAFAPAQGGEASFEAGVALARELAAPDLRGVLVLSDGLHVNGTELVRGLNSALPPEVIVTGGLAGDGDRFQRTWVLQGGAPPQQPDLGGGPLRRSGPHGPRLQGGLGHLRTGSGDHPLGGQRAL